MNNGKYGKCVCVCVCVFLKPKKPAGHNGYGKREAENAQQFHIVYAKLLHYGN